MAPVFQKTTQGSGGPASVDQTFKARMAIPKSIQLRIGLVRMTNLGACIDVYNLANGWLLCGQVPVIFNFAFAVPIIFCLNQGVGLH